MRTYSASIEKLTAQNYVTFYFSWVLKFWSRICEWNEYLDYTVLRMRKTFVVVLKEVVLPSENAASERVIFKSEWSTLGIHILKNASSNHQMFTSSDWNKNKTWFWTGVNPTTTFQASGKSAWILKKTAREKQILQKL